MSTALIAALGAGFVAAVMNLTVLSASPGGLILVYLSPLPLFGVGLALGLAAALVASVASVLVIAVVAQGVVLPLTFAALSVMPVLVLVRQALLSRRDNSGSIQWYPPGLLLVVLAGLGMTAILFAVLALGSGDDLKDAIRAMLAGSLAEVFSSNGISEANSPSNATVEVLSQVFPGALAVSWLMMVFVNGLLAQSLLERFNRLSRPPLAMVEVELPAWAPLILSLTLLGAVFLEGGAGFLMVNLAIVEAVPFMFAGLAVVHVLAAKRASGVMVLVGFYLVLLLLAWPVLVVIGLGLIEQWAGLRRRFAASSPGRGEA
ncbi:MAG: DUF2232 domain-containing protein [Rhodospirillaceae bacterium]